MEGSESSLSSYYHYHQQHLQHHHSGSPTTTTATTTAGGAGGATNGMFSNTHHHNASSGHYAASEGTPMGFSPHTVSSRAPVAASAPPETVRRKRGRPRKYGVSEGPPSATASASAKKVSASTSSSLPLSSPPRKKEQSSSSSSSSSKKAQLVALGHAGQGFTPHVITVAAGEDVAQKIMSFMQQRKRAVCILSASGSISNASLRQPATLGGNVTYEGRFEILSLTGSFLHSEIGGATSRTGGLSVCLSGTDGRIIGGGVGGPLKAAGPVQVIAGSFVIDTKKDVSDGLKVEASANKLPSPLVGATISSVGFRPAPDSSGRISVRGNDHQNIGASHFMLQPRGMHVMSSRSMDWRSCPDARSSADMELTGRMDRGACQSPEDGDDEHIRK